MDSSKRKQSSFEDNNSKKPCIDFLHRYLVTQEPELDHPRENGPALDIQAVYLVEIYKSLWGSYNRECDRTRQLEQEWQTLQNSNKWLTTNNGQLQFICATRDGKIRDCHQDLQSVREGLLDIIQKTRKHHVFLSSQ